MPHETTLALVLLGGIIAVFVTAFCLAWSSLREESREIKPHKGIIEPLQIRWICRRPDDEP